MLSPALDAQALDGRFAASAPQNMELDVRPIERAIQQQVDARLRIVWHPHAYHAQPGRFDAFGKPIPPRTEGRWQVVIPGRRDGALTVIHTLGAEIGPDHPYRPVGWWLLDFLREWDMANADALRRRAAVLAQNDQLDAAARAASEAQADEATHRYAANVLKDRAYPGIGADFSAAAPPPDDTETRQ